VFVGESLGSLTRLVPFQFNTEQGYILEFGHYTMRVIKDGGFVVHTGSVRPSWVASTAYYVGDYVVNAGVDYVCIADHTSSPTDEPGASSTGWESFWEESAASTAPEWGASADYEGDDFIYTPTDGTIYRCITNHTSEADNKPGSGTSWEEYWIVDSVLRVATPYAASDLARLKFVQSADTIYFAHPDYPPYLLSRTSHTAWQWTKQTFSPGVTAPAGGAAATNGGAGTYSIDYKVSAVGDDGEESLPSEAFTVADAWPSNNWEAGAWVDLSWDAVEGASSYNIYKNSNGYYGWIGQADSNSFKDTNIEPDVGDGPQSAFSGFAEVGEYPGAVSFHQQRLFYGGSMNDPQTIWGSQNGLFNNFGTSSPLKDSDGIEATIVSRQVNEVRHFVPMEDLLIFTAGGEWKLTTGENSDALSPTSMQFKVQGYRGCTHLPPLVIGNTVLFVQRGGRVVRDFAYELTSDSYTGTDLTVLAEHLLRDNSVVAWAYQQDPNSIIWCVRDDGVLLGHTYLKEHEVWAWHRHETDGLFRDVAVLEGDDADETYFTVEREVNGSTVFYIEKLAERLPGQDLAQAWFVDCGLQYSGTPASTISGLEHLEGKTIAILADGSPVAPQVVTNGQVTLPQAASVATVGLPFTSDIETLNIEAGGGETMQGRKKNVTAVTLRFENSLGGSIGPDERGLVDIKQTLPKLWGDMLPLRIEDYRVALLPAWNTNGRILFRQTLPLPFTILAIIPEVKIGG
jgi:hypothetical protein